MKKFAIFICIQFSALLSFSQYGYVAGYIIKYTGDTVRGKIKDRSEPNNKIAWQKIQFINAVGEKEKFTAEDIWGYVKSDTVEFRSLALGVEEKKRFSKIVESGAVVLFSYNLGLSQNAEPTYYLQKAKDIKSLMQWREGDYKRTAAYFFKDDKELMKLIDGEVLKEKDVLTIVRKYNEGKEK